MSEVTVTTIRELLGAVVMSCDAVVGAEEVTMSLADGRTMTMNHEKDCCEEVALNDIVGEWADIIGSPLLVAEEVAHESEDTSDGSQTWTFYRFATIKGTVTLRWLGQSNGYYSESVSFFINSAPEAS